MDNIYTCTGHPLQSDIESAVQWMLEDDFTTCYKKMVDLKTSKGLALQDIIEDIHVFIFAIDFPPKCRIFLLEQLAAIESRLTAGVDEKLQLSALIGAFKRTSALAIPVSD
jgi:replication factor C subunit 3/5